MSGLRKKHIVTMRLTDEQLHYLDQMVSRIEDHTGTRVTRTSVIKKLMRYGYPHLEKDFPRKPADKELDKGA